MSEKIAKYKIMKIVLNITIVSIIILNILWPSKILADDNLGEWNVKHVTGKFLYSNPPKPDVVFNFKSRVINGTLENLTITQIGPYIAKVQSSSSGIFELELPRNYPFSNMISGPNSAAFINVNGRLIDLQQYSFVATDCFYAYSIPFSGTSIISLSIPAYPESMPFQASKVPYHCMKETIYNPSTMPLSSPLKQIQSGISPEDVICGDDMALVLENNGNSSACVFPESAAKLVLLGWARNPLSDFLTSNNLSSNMTDNQKDKAFYDIMNLPRLKEWSSTGWTFVQVAGLYQNPERNIHRTYAELYLSPKLGNPKVYCEYGWYAWLTVNTQTLQVENGTYPEPDSCTKQFQMIRTP